MAGAHDEDLSYPSLVNRWRRERSAPGLTKMDGRFYETFEQHLKSLRDEYAKEHAVNPATPKVLILQDELMNLTRVRDDLYDLRERKIATAAIIAARGGNPDRSQMTKEEDALFESVLSVLRDARRNLLRRGQPPPTKEAPRAGPPSPPDPAPAPANAASQAAVLAERATAADASPEAPLPGAPAPTSPAPARAVEEVTASDEGSRRGLGPARVLVRVKAAVAPFVGTDLRTYRLAQEDVAAVPKDVAHALVQRGLAQALSG